MSNNGEMVEDGEDRSFMVRRAESLDSEGVARLIKRQTEALFGRVNVDDVIEKECLGICLTSEEDNLLAFAAFNDHPSLSFVQQSEWEQWIHSNYKCPQANPFNSLFLKLFVSQDNYSQDALKEILKTSFITAPHLQYIFLCIPPTTTDLGSALEMFFSPVEAHSTENDDVPLLYVTNRYQHYPVLHVRLAKVEDNDDLLPIIQQCSTEELIKQYGDYFIAELIESQDKDHQTIVAEVDGRAVGFMSITTDIDLNLLWDNYQLEPYHGLRKPCDEDIITATPLETHTTNSLQSSIKSVDKHLFDNTTGEEMSIGKASGQSSQVSTSTDVSVPYNKVKKKQYILHGSSNAVVVQLFCMKEQYEMRSIDLLPAVFDLFPEVDFIVLTLPHSFPHYPLLSHFTHVSSREGSSVSQELYVLHKCSLLHSLQVKPLEDTNVDLIGDFVSSLSSEQTILEDVKRYIEGKRDPLTEGATPIYAFVIQLLGQIVGIVILRQEENLLYLLSHYNIEDHVYFAQHDPSEHMHLHHLLINPILAPHIKHILKEVMRLSHSNNLYYPLPLPESVNSTNHSLTLALHEMVPVRPRRQICYPAGLEVNAPVDDITDAKPNATLYHTNRKLSLEPKISINTHIVCVGASDTTLSLLECLVFSPHLRFNNLILVSHNGLSTSQSALSPDSCCFYDNALAKIGLEAWVTVIPGSLTAIDRELQSITVQTATSTDTILHYDYLVLSTGLQYAIEMPKYGHIPENGLVILNEDNCTEIMEKTQQEYVDGNIVVYGSDLISYSVIHHLLSKWNIQGENITLVQPRNSPLYFTDTIQETITQSLISNGVQILNGYTLHQYYTDSSLKHLKGIELVQNTDVYVTVPCTLMFCLETKQVDKLAFQAINNACLVYDSRLVINPEHFTNDPCILGAGPLTKFSRYYRTPWCHEYFNSHEVGERLASTILSKLDPTYVNNTTTTNCTDLIPTYYQPKEIYAVLPGNHYYLHIDKPRITANTRNKGHLLSTLTDNGYFELYINKYNRIETITILSKQLFEVSNYRCLYNIHEQYLNNLLTRWTNKLIPDLFLYFREQWTCAIFHDRFPDFLIEINDILTTPMEENGSSLKDKVKQILEDSTTFSVQDNDEKIGPAFASSNLSGTINKRLHRYLLYNAYHLPMYAQSDMA